MKSVSQAVEGGGIFLGISYLQIYISRQPLLATFQRDLNISYIFLLLQLCLLFFQNKTIQSLLTAKKNAF